MKGREKRRRVSRAAMRTHHLGRFLLVGGGCVQGQRSGGGVGVSTLESHARGCATLATEDERVTMAVGGVTVSKVRSLAKERGRRLSIRRRAMVFSDETTRPTKGTVYK